MNDTNSQHSVSLKTFSIDVFELNGRRLSHEINPVILTKITSTCGHTEWQMLVNN